jgi:hypothetical protein
LQQYFRSSEMRFKRNRTALSLWQPDCRRDDPSLGPHVRFRRVQTLVWEDSPLVKLRNSAYRTARISPDLVAALQELAAREGSSLEQLLVGGLNQSLSWTTIRGYAPHVWVMEEPTQIEDGLAQQSRCSGLRSVRTSIAHGRCIMRNHDLVSDGFLLIAASLVLLGSSLLALSFV